MMRKILKFSVLLVTIAIALGIGGWSRHLERDRQLISNP